MFSSKRKRQLVLLEIAAASALLVACGGGGDAAEGAATEQTVASAPAETTDPAAAPVAAAPAVDPEVSGETAPEIALEPGETPMGSLEAQAQLAAQSAPQEEESSEGEREEAQSLTIDPGDSGYARPRVAALDYTSSTSLTKRQQLAKFKFVILGARGGSDLNAFTSGIKSINPNTKLAYYVVFSELKCYADSGTYHAPAVQEANRAGWWLRRADGSRTQWTSAYDACEMNTSSWGKRNAAGQTWTQYKARFDYDRIFRNAPAIEYAFSDNTLRAPRVDADWKRIGTNQLRSDPTIQAAQRAGQAAYWSALRSLKPSIKIIGNADSDLSYSEYAEKLNGAMQEGAMGKSYSLETWSTWAKMMERHRGQIRNTSSPNDAFLAAHGSTTNYKLVRYGLASALMDNGWFVYIPTSGSLQPTWYDEYSAPIGTPTEAPPTAPKQNGIWMRKYQNGLVLVNPSKTTTASIYVGSGYKRLKGTQDPTVNNGAAQSTVTLAPRSGLIMIRQ